MRDTELKLQPPNVREEFEKITNSDVDGDELIVVWKGELKLARGLLSAAREQHDRVRSVLDTLKGAVDGARTRTQEIDDQRAEVIAVALVDGGDFACDNELLGRHLPSPLTIDVALLTRAN